MLEFTSDLRQNFPSTLLHACGDIALFTCMILDLLTQALHDAFPHKDACKGFFIVFQSDLEVNNQPLMELQLP